MSAPEVRVGALPRPFVLTAALVSLLACVTEVEPSERSSVAGGDLGTAQYIVVLKDSIGAHEVAARTESIIESVRRSVPSLKSLRAKRHRTIGGKKSIVEEQILFRHVFRGFVARLAADDEARLQALREHPDVAFISKDGVLKAAQQEPLFGMQRIRARNNATAQINDIHDVDVDVDIAILDSGIDPTHEDLNLYRSVDFVRDEPHEGDPSGHGTHVAGIAAAIDNDFGVHGVAPGARLWSVRVLDAAGFADDSEIVEGFDFVLEHADEIEVINMSIANRGGIPDDRNCGRTNENAVQLAICRLVEAGVVIVVAAGNGAQFTGRAEDATQYYPARYPEVITVSAVAELDGLGPGAVTDPIPGDNAIWIKSNFGIAVDLAAPGVDVYSTFKDNSYEFLTGTSMAAPAVAGAAALWIVKNGKPRGAKDVRKVRDELVRLSFPNNGFDNGFSDTEDFGEPLLDVGAIDLIEADPLEPRLFSDRYTYTVGKDCPALIAAVVQDDRGLPVTGLPPNGFVSHLKGKQVDLTFTELGRGRYLAALDISELEVGPYDFHVVVKDHSGFARTAGLEFVVQTAEPSLLIRRLEASWPIIPPNRPQQLLATITYGDGTPFTYATGAPFFTTKTFFWDYSPGGFLFWEMNNFAYGRWLARTTSPSALGVYSLDFKVQHEGLSDEGRMTYEVATPPESLSAELEINRNSFDFTQSIAPTPLVLEVFVQNEFLRPVPSLDFFVEEPFEVFIDGERIGMAGLEATRLDRARYRSEGIELGALAEGSHVVEVSVVDQRNVTTTTNAVGFRVLRSSGPRIEPPPVIWPAECSPPGGVPFELEL